MIARRVAAAILLSIPLSVVFYTDSLRSRIASSVPHSRTCLHNLVVSAAPQARILITGSSRARQSVDPDALAKRAGLSSSSVVNAAHPSRNPWLDHVMIAHAARAGNLKLVIVEIQVGSPDVLRREVMLKGRPSTDDSLLRLTSGSYRREQITTNSYSETVEVLASGAPSLVLATYDILNALFLKLEYAMKPLLSGKVRKLLLFGDPDIDPRRQNVCWPSDVNAPNMQSGTARQRALKEQAQRRFIADHPTGIEGVPYDTDEFLNRDYAANDRDAGRRIVALARERDLQLVFFHLPAYYTAPPSPKFQSEFQRLIGAPLLIPGRETLSMLYPHYYDSTHLNSRGMEIFTSWIAGELERLGLIRRAG